jgi:hypothetical protein
MKIRSLLLLPLAFVTAVPTTFAANPACSRVKPGHYWRVTDDNTRRLDGLSTLKNELSKDVRNFKGVVYQINWGMIEKSWGVYDFSRIDNALAQAKAKGKYLMIRFMDRTFHTGCGSGFVPSYVAKEQSTSSSRICFAKIWETATMDSEIRVLQAVAKRYQGNPNFLGFMTEETAIGAPTFASKPSTYNTLYSQLKRAAAAVHSAAPALLFVQEINWPVYNDIKAFYGIADAHQAMGGGGGIGWPNSVPSKQYTWSWYQVGRDRRSRLVVMPRAETGGGLVGTRAEAEKVYNMLVNDIQVHAIVWDTWAAEDANYFSNAVIPTVNKYNGAVKNTACPY